MGNIEDNFVTLDQDKDGNRVTFNLIEDESGDTYWGYGHVDPRTFIAELNRWIVHTLGEGEEIWSDPDELAKAGTSVDHLWARYREDGEVFELVEPTMTEADASNFPVTRVWL